MTLIVILNAILAVGIVAVIFSLHTRAIMLDHRHHHGSARLWSWRGQTQVVSRTPRHASRSARPGRAIQARRPAAALD